MLRDATQSAGTTIRRSRLSDVTPECRMEVRELTVRCGARRFRIWHGLADLWTWRWSAFVARLAARHDRFVVKIGDYESAPDAAAASWVVDGLRGFADSVVSLVLQELPPRQRTALVLRYFNGLSAAEIAEVLGCSMGTVQSPGIAGPGPAAGKHGTQRESTVSPRLEALLS